MEFVNSKEKLLTPSEIIACASINTGYGDSDKTARDMAQAAISLSADAPNRDTKQIGNTLFVGYFGLGKGQKKKMMGQGWNADTPFNFMKNGYKYFSYLQKRGITHYLMGFDSTQILNAFKIWQKALEGSDSSIQIGRSKKDSNKYV